MAGKAAFLSRLTRRARFYKRVDVGKRVEGASPPSVFIGSYGYPKVFAGPLVPPSHGDTRIMDYPEQWLSEGGGQQEIIDFRLQLVRGKTEMHIRDQSRQAQMLKEIALSEKSTEVEAEFSQKPAGGFFHEELQPFGPSAPIKEMSVDSGKWDQKLEKAFYDTDLKATDAMTELYEKGSVVSSIQRALSVGALGLGKNRRMVPTRWSITAVDSALSEKNMAEVKQNEAIGEYRVYEHESLSNKFVMVLSPALWNYEWVEAFMPHDIFEKLEVFSDREGFERKKQYSVVGGCYYSVRLAVAEALAKEGRQAGALVLREAYEDYVPLGVWNCRENARAALAGKPEKFESFKDALEYAHSRLRIKPEKWREHSQTIRRPVAQTTLKKYL
ncbi:MAG: Nre family DNA repair protein [Candidatus Micrarchaeota archaeon]|nr:Nre family DNA repair protein [Candidatus Micrarchaeota archaeon]